MSDSVDLLRKVVELRPNGEHRPQQETAVEAIEQAIDEHYNLLMQAGTGTGKALDVSTPILTTSGWKTMGDLVAGDVIFDEQGQQTRVLMAHEPFQAREAYRLIFSDGSTIIADAEHLWATSTRRERAAFWRDDNRVHPLRNRDELNTFRENLSSIATALPRNVNPLVLSRAGIRFEYVKKASESLEPTAVSSNGKPQYDTVALLERTYLTALNDETIRTSHGLTLRIRTTREIASSLTEGTYRNHAVPVLSQAIHLPEQNLSITPYVLGVWLGDGDSNGATITSHDADMRSLIEAEGYHTSDVKQDEHRFRINVGEAPVNNHWADSITQRLRLLGVQQNKHIPMNYLLSSIQQRQALLSGLLDTDGYVDRNGIYEFCVTNRILAQNFFTLVASLGYKPSMREGEARLNDRYISQKWTISFCAAENLFRIHRKQAMFAERVATRNITPLRNDLRYIVDAELLADMPTVRCITVDSPSHLFLAGEALIPTHNTLSYLLPLVVTKKKAVISTATKQLSEQISKSDIPALRKAMRQLEPNTKVNAALLKGRENYFCHYKANQGTALDNDAASLFAMGESDSSISATGKKMAKEIKDLRDWSDETSTGDRSDAPNVSDQIWRQHSATSTECVGRNNCPFGEICFAERARDKARKADIVVTNHAVVGHDLMAEDEGILGERAVYVFDELHELDNYLSNAWGTRLTAKMVRDSHKAFSAVSELGEKPLAELESVAKKWEDTLEKIPEGLIEEMPSSMENHLRALYRSTAAISVEAGRKAKEGDVGENLKKALTVIKKRADELSEAAELLLDSSIETVRWKSVSETSESLNAAPLRVGPRLQLALSSRNAIMIGTSATITVGGGFEIPVHNLDLDNAGSFKTVDLGTPFDYKKQAMLYIPDPDTFPAPTGAERKAHSEASQQETYELIRALGGRSLVLCTTNADMTYMARFLRKKLPKMHILLQGEAPNPQLVEEFKKHEKSVLVATMGMWHGLDVQGDSLSLVVMTKVPFKPMDDPLSLARQRYADANGRNGFMDVYVADANVMLAQGAGRLIRHRADKGVIAILDTRLLTKRYGQSMLKSLPPLTVRTNHDQIIAALERLSKIIDSRSGD